jgi:hypothetical protein
MRVHGAGLVAHDNERDYAGAACHPGCGGVRLVCGDDGRMAWNGGAVRRHEALPAPDPPFLLVVGQFEYVTSRSAETSCR